MFAGYAKKMTARHRKTESRGGKKSECMGEKVARYLLVKFNQGS